MNNKVAIYCRLSEEDKNKLSPMNDSESIQNQKNMLTKYSIDQGWSIFNIYSDDDYTGLDSNRPEFKKLLKDAEDKKFNIILCKSQARFTRDMELVEKYLHNKFVLWGIRFIGLADNADTLNKGNKKQRQISGLVNEWYCEDISENIKSVFDYKRNNGQFIGSFATYGYIKDPENKNRIIIDEDPAKVVQLIFDLYLQGHGSQHIAYILNDRKIPNPTKHKQDTGLKYINAHANNNFGLWNKTTVKRILKNEMFIGNMIQGKRKKVSYKSKKVIATTEDQWIKVENTHEPIIDKKTFKEVQRRMSVRQRTSGEGQSHIFATKVRCADCGNTMVKNSTSNNGIRYSYLRCKLYTLVATKKLCSSHFIQLDHLEKVVTEKIRNYIDYYLDDTNLTNILQTNEETIIKLNKLKNELNNINKQINLNSEILKNLYVDKVKKIIDDEEFTNLKNDFEKEKNRIFNKKLEIEECLLLEDEKKDNINEWKNIVSKYKNFKKLTHEIVNEFVNYIEIGEKDKSTKQQEIIIHWII
jgi:DNA invertase Pin-like site-specific DNA recombinase